MARTRVAGLTPGHRIAETPVPKGAFVTTTSTGPSPEPVHSSSDPFGFFGLTYDDVLLLPNATDVIPADADTGTRLTRNILSLIHISEPTRLSLVSRMPSSA